MTKYKYRDYTNKKTYYLTLDEIEHIILQDVYLGFATYQHLIDQLQKGKDLEYRDNDTKKLLFKVSHIKEQKQIIDENKNKC